MTGQTTAEQGISKEAAGTSYGAASLGLGLTRQLADHVASTRFSDLPANTVAAARRGIIDWLGCAIAGSGQPGPGIVYRTLSAETPGEAVAIGRSQGLAPRDAALFNGTAGHMLDFDDTHMGGVILHCSSPVLSALLATRATARFSGADLVLSYVLAFDAAVRTGQAAMRHHDGGWHLTGTLGTIGAAVAVARVLGLDGLMTTHAIALAATQASGMQQNRGTMAKSFHAGKAAANGLLAAQLAANGFDGSTESLEGKRGFIRIYSTQSAPEALVDGLGKRWEITANGFKPYACGVVLHPAMDAMIGLRDKVADPTQVREVLLTVNPAALRITGVVSPETGLKSKFSISHAAAVSFLDQAGGIAQFANDRVTAADVREFVAKIRVETDEALARDQARAEAVLVDGNRVSHVVAHATGTVGNPMTDTALDAKFIANAAPVLGDAAAARILELGREIDRLDDAAELFALLAAPGPGGGGGV
ncbi:MmgE/PrpD family protein [Paracoccus onubensis]|nr:MmgE/PrpD family protein [Paracoccus onubensis]